MTMQVAQARSEGLGQLYLDLTVTDAIYGNPRFLLGGSRFISTNVHGGAPVSPVVLSWGAFQSGLSSEISGDAGGQIILNANDYLIQVNGTNRFTVAGWLRQIQFREAEASLYQWNATESTQELLWKGYIIGITDSRFSIEHGYAVELMLSGTHRDMEKTDISDLITKAAFSAAPIGLLGRMVPRDYGSIANILSSTDVGGGVAKVGFPFQGFRGVIVDENQATAKVKVRFSKNDGSFSWSSFPTGTSDDAGSYGGLWVYDSASGLYGMVDNASYSVTNDVNKTEVVVDAAPKVFFYLRPKQIGSTNAAALTDAYKVIDSDSANFSVSTTTDFTWGFYLPSVSFGGRIKSIGVMADWQNAHASKSRQVTFGIWDIYHSVAANWLNQTAAKHQSITKLLGDPRIITMQDVASKRYTAANFYAHLIGAQDTASEFASGSFVTNNASNTQATLELKVEVQELGGPNSGRESVHLYNVGIVIEVDYLPALPYQLPTWFTRGDTPNPHIKQPVIEVLERLGGLNEQARLASIPGSLSRIAGTDFFARGGAQKDDGAGTYSGTVSGVIKRPMDIAYHILSKVSGQSVNATAGTLGNFIDPRTNGALKDLNLIAPFGPEPVKRKAALERLTSRLPMSLYRRAGVWRCIPDDLNPHSSCVYRSTSEVIEIGPNDIEIESFSDRELDSSEFVNAVQLNYSHGYPDREAGAQTTYDNHLSQKWFGKKFTEPYEYPEIIQESLESAADAGPTALAQWLGRRSARPLRIVSTRLFNKSYDIEPGHCIGFKTLEHIGIPVQAFRDGLLDYQFNSAAGGTDYADSAAAVLISLTSSAALFGLSRQTDRLTFSIATGAAYTPVANAWRYSNAGGFGNFGSIVNTNGLQGTGTQTISWALPNWWEWIKTELTLGGTTYGPCYWIQFNHTSPTVAGLANARTSYLVQWKGRYFKVLKANRRPGGNSRGYPFKDMVALEVA